MQVLAVFPNKTKMISGERMLSVELNVRVT